MEQVEKLDILIPKRAFTKAQALEEDQGQSGRLATAPTLYHRHWFPTGTHDEDFALDLLARSRNEIYSQPVVNH